MYDFAFYIPFNSISVIAGQRKDEHGRFSAMKRHLGMERISPPVGFEPETPEVRRANYLATWMLQLRIEITILGVALTDAKH